MKHSALAGVVEQWHMALQCQCKPKNLNLFLRIWAITLDNSTVNRVTMNEHDRWKCSWAHTHTQMKVLSKHCMNKWNLKWFSSSEQFKHRMGSAGRLQLQNYNVVTQNSRKDCRQESLKRERHQENDLTEEHSSGVSCVRSFRWSGADRAVLTHLQSIQVLTVIAVSLGMGKCFCWGMLARRALGFLFVCFKYRNRLQSIYITVTVTWLWRNNHHLAGSLNSNSTFLFQDSTGFV